MKKEPTKPKMGRPPTGQMPMRYFRMDDEDWQQIESAASLLGETTSKYIRRILLKSSAADLKKKD